MQHIPYRLDLLKDFAAFEEDYFNQAKDKVIETIAFAEQDKDVLLDPVFLRYFDRFGRSLKAEPAKLLLQ